MQKYDFITLDIFRKNIYNRGIQDELDDNTVEYMIDELQGIADDAIERLRQAKEETIRAIVQADQAKEEANQAQKRADQAKEEADQAKEEASQAQKQADQAKAQAHQEKERADKAEEEKRQLERKYQELLARLEESEKM